MRGMLLLGLWEASLLRAQMGNCFWASAGNIAGGVSLVSYADLCITVVKKY